jgi:hypothetical protein
MLLRSLKVWGNDFFYNYLVKKRINYLSIRHVYTGTLVQFKLILETMWKNKKSSLGDYIKLRCYTGNVIESKPTQSNENSHLKWSWVIFI